MRIHMCSCNRYVVGLEQLVVFWSCIRLGKTALLLLTEVIQCHLRFINISRIICAYLFLCA